MNLPADKPKHSEIASLVAPGVSRVRPAVFRSLNTAAKPAAPEEGPASRGSAALRAYAPAPAPLPWVGGDQPLLAPAPQRQAAPLPLPAARPSAPVAQRLPAGADLEGQLAPLRGLSRELVARGMGAPLVAELLSEIVAEFGNQVLQSEQDARLALIEQLLLRIQGEALIPADLPLVGAYLITGPSGSGKSALIGHLALAAASRGQSDVVLVNTEAERIGAAAQTEALGKVFGFAVEHLYTPQELRALQTRSAPGALLLVEAAGWSPEGGIDRRLNAWAWQVPMARNVICVPATAQGEDLRDLLSGARQVASNPIAALCKTSETRNALPALGALAALRQAVGVAVASPNPLDAAALPDLSMLVRSALGVVTPRQRKDVCGADAQDS